MRTKQKNSFAKASERIKAGPEEITIGQPLDLAILAIKERAARCLILGTNRELTLRAERLWEIIPGEMVTIHPEKFWSYAGHPYLSGKILKNRLDIPALGLSPLKLEERGEWNPKEEYWGEDEKIPDWAKLIVEFGPRPQFEMEQVLPGQDPDDPFTDPIVEASELNECDNAVTAKNILMEVLSQDLRCLDAHAHLGNFAFNRRPEDAIRHYEVGVKIGELSLKSQSGAVLPWGWINNRPFLRCLNGFGLCLWKLGRMDQALKVFERLLWLNPSDNQGVRGIIPEVRANQAWRE